MTLSVRQRIRLLFLPATLFLIGVGSGGVWLLDNLGRRSEEIIRENVVSLRAMFDLNTDLTGMEQVVLWAVQDSDRLHPDKARRFQELAGRAREACRVELANVTVPGEREAATAMTGYVELAILRGQALLDAPAAARWELYIAPDTGFQRAVNLARLELDEVWVLNEAAVYLADDAARATARRSVVVLAIGVGACMVLTIGSAWWLIRTVLGPIRQLTEAVRAVRGGDLAHRIPGGRRDEFGELASAFNDMAEQLWLVKQTNYRTLVRAREAARATIDSFPSPVLVIDPEGLVELANPAARRLFGLTAPTAAWVPPDALRQPLADALRDQRAHLTETFDQALALRADGGERVYLPQVRPIRGDRGDTLGAAVVLDDVTQFRLLDQLKGDFVSTVGHELKTPLTGLRMAVHLLLEEAVGPLAPKQVELLIDARDNAERLFALVEQLLALARLEDRREFLSLEPTPVEDLFRRAADAVAVRAADKTVSVIVEDTSAVPRLAADPVRFGHALDNLLTNAVTYTPAGGTVTLSASADGERVRLTVTDTGVGIPATQLPHVFEKFFRVPDADHPPGTGLGLAIVREIVTAHDGDITCESTLGVGTTFRITLPSWKGDRA